MGDTSGPGYATDYDEAGLVDGFVLIEREVEGFEAVVLVVVVVVGGGGG